MTSTTSLIDHFYLTFHTSSILGQLYQEYQLYMQKTCAIIYSKQSNLQMCQKQFVKYTFGRCGEMHLNEKTNSHVYHI